MSGPFSAAALLGRRVQWQAVRLGVTHDLLLDRGLGHVLGFVVRTDAGDSFLPFGACTIPEGSGAIRVHTPLSLLARGEEEYYGPLSRSLRSLEQLRDVLLTRDGRVTEVLLGRVWNRPGVGSSQRMPASLADSSPRDRVPTPTSTA